jgi:hypothetical protein
MLTYSVTQRDGFGILCPQAMPQGSPRVAPHEHDRRQMARCKASDAIRRLAGDPDFFARGVPGNRHHAELQAPQRGGRAGWRQGAEPPKSTVESGVRNARTVCT